MMKLWLPILLLMFPRFASAQIDPAPARQFVRQYAGHYGRSDSRQPHRADRSGNCEACSWSGFGICP